MILKIIFILYRISIYLKNCVCLQINGAAFTPNNMMVTGGDDGSVRVWSLKNKEQALQFQVIDQVRRHVLIITFLKWFGMLTYECYNSLEIPVSIFYVSRFNF